METVLLILFQKIVSMSIIASVVGVTILIVRKLFQNQISPKWLMRIWFIFLLSLLIPLQIQSNFSIYNILPIQLEQVQEIGQTITIPTPKQETIEPSQKNVDGIEEKGNIETFTSMAEILAICWFSIMIFFFLTNIILYIFFLQKMKSRAVITEEIQEVLENCKKKFSIKRKITIMKQGEIKTPSIMGIFSIKILMPPHLLETINKEELENILLHELAHYKNKDTLLNGLLLVLKSIYFFNPLIWLFFSYIKKDMELRVDEIVVKDYSKQEKKNYCKLLVSLTSGTKNPLWVNAMCLSNHRSNLERRIDMVKLTDKFKAHKVVISISSIIIIAILVIAFCTVADPIYDTSELMTKDQIIALLKKGEECPNYYYKISKKTGVLIYSDSEPIESIEFYIKDRKYAQKINRENGISTVFWEDGTTGENIAVFYPQKCVLLGNTNMGKYAFSLEKAIKGRNQIDFSYYTGMNYLGKTKVNGRNTVAVKLTKESNPSVIVYVDEESGLIVKQTIKTIFFNHTEYKEISFGTVTEEQVARTDYIKEYPDYEVIDLEEQEKRVLYRGEEI